MRVYLWITGFAFAVVTGLHIWRMTVEKSLASDLSFVGLTVLTAALAIWAFRLLRPASRANGGSSV